MKENEECFNKSTEEKLIQYQSQTISHFNSSNSMQSKIYNEVHSIKQKIGMFALLVYISIFFSAYTLGVYQVHKMPFFQGFYDVASQILSKRTNIGGQQ